MADEFSVDGMLDMYLYENGQLLEKLEELVLENKDEENTEEASELLSRLFLARSKLGID